MILTCGISRRPGDHGLQLAGGHDQRVAARQQHVRDLGVLADVFQAVRNVFDHLVVIVHEQPLAEAKAAVGAAYVVHEEQGRIAVLVFETGNFGVEFLEGGVQAAPFIQFVFARNDQLANRIVRVIPVDEALVIVVGTENELLLDRPKSIFLGIAQLGDLIDASQIFWLFQNWSPCKTSLLVSRILRLTKKECE